MTKHFVVEPVSLTIYDFMIIITNSSASYKPKHQVRLISKFISIWTPQSEYCRCSVDAHV